MDKWILRDAERYASAHRRKRRWYQVMTCLAAVVVFCTTYALILPAITLEKQCQIPEHTHTDSCYTQVTSREKSVLACEVEADAVIHKHDAACRDEDGNLVCSLPELEAHRHTDSCYTIPEVHAHTDACYTWEQGELTCTQSTEPRHIHTEACYQESSDLVCGTSVSTGHAHGADCFDNDGNLICDQEESQGHTHGEGCYQVSRQLICGQTEEPAHQHTDECYSWNRVLTCGQSTEAAQPVLTCEKDEIELHTHQPFVSEEDRGCYDADGENLVCGKPQVVEHQHTGACFKTVTEAVDTETLTCTLPEDETHTHTTLCYGTWELTCGLEEHTHSEACTPTEPVYTCGKEAHTHSETCRDANGELICTLEEHTHSEECTAPEETTYCGKEAHTHSETCRDENGELICTLEEHTHSLACYSDPTADVETAEIWEQTFADVTLTGNWRQDAVSIAQTQLGYTESTKNYMVAEDGETVKGYTCYGAWYGEPYADWDTMFLSFCLHYAGVEDVPMEADCGSWATAWADGFVPAQSHETAAGDLVFFDRDGDGAADHAGLVTEVTDSGFTAIEGDVEDAVRLLSYGADDATILGYVNLPEGAKEFTLTAQTETGITVTITGDSASVPYPAREITVTVKEVTDEESIAIRDQLLGEEAAEPEQSFLLDITLWHGEEEIEPTGPVTVTFSGFDTEGLYPEVYHIDTEAQTATDMEAEKEENGDVTVATDHFSMYAMVWRSAQKISGFIGEKLAKGGVFQLEGNAWTYEDGKNAQLTISKDTTDTTIDLNGHILTISKSHQFFEVPNGATLTIMDSATVSDSVSYPDGTLYGNRASLNDNTLTYYITKSEATADGTGTKEKLEKHEVNLSSVGRIVCSEASDQAVLVNGGTLRIQGGLLNSDNKGGRVVCVNSGTLTMEGGYLVGGSRDQGGGVYSNNNATVNISGGVIAANHANAGGGIYMNGGTVSISGGVISGNETTGNATTGNWGTGLGGGVFAQDTTVTISGGYITNNRESSKCEQNGFGCHGGGGIATKGGSLTMEGGFVTGNYSAEAGGGMYVGHYNLGGTNFSMSGGIVAGNVAQQSEGGGIRISGQTDGTIQASGKVYITNNRTNSTFDWGGGGIFVQEKGNLSIVNSLITNNSAGGFGGGVGACPTGETMVVHNDGAAIYSNTADGTTMSGGGNGKIYDVEARNDSNFMFGNRFQDYFCVKEVNTGNYISLVTGEMVGGGAANWKGSCDGQKIEISKTGHAAAKYRFGLTAYPDSSAISSAQAVAGVIITGNSAHTHGGGIMTNGGLILGRKETVITATPALDITAEKVLMVDGSAVSSGRDFQFRLTDSDGNEVGTATADASTGRFTIAPNKKYDTAGTYTYYLTEVNDGRPGVTYDSSQYRIDVTIAEKSVTLMGVTFKSYYVDTVNVTKSGSGGSSSGGSSGGGSSGGGSTSSGGTTTPSAEVILHFYNYGNWDEVALSVFNQQGVDASAYTVNWPGGRVSADAAHTGWYTASIPVIGPTAFFRFKFNNNNHNEQTAELVTGEINGGAELWITDSSTVLHAAPDGWSGRSTRSSDVSITTVKNPDESYSLTINDSAFTNTQTSLKFQILKKDSNNADTVLQGAEFRLKKQGESTDKTVTTGSNGIADFGQIETGTYYLYENKAPDGYMLGGPWILEIGSEERKIYPATVDGGNLTKANETAGTELGVSGTGPIVLTATIVDEPGGYELPKTGGAGTQPYTMGGIALMAAAVMFLLYSHTRRRKEDAPSS